MLEGLLVLILLTNPVAQDDAEVFAKKLEAYATRTLTIQHGKEANLKLAELLGIAPTDLLAAGTIGKTLTKHQKIVLVHLDHRTVNGDVILEARLWYDGREENYVSIAGNDRDPMSGLVEGSLSMIGYLLRDDKKQSGLNTVSTVSLSQLAKEKAWEQLLGKIAGIPPKERAPMVHYYQIMAYVNLENRDEAVASLNRFRLVYKDHLLVTSAESIIPSRQHSEQELLDLGGAKTLDPLFEGGSMEIEKLEPVGDKKEVVPEPKKDAVLTPADDGGNTLR